MALSASTNSAIFKPVNAIRIISRAIMFVGSIAFALLVLTGGNSLLSPIGYLSASMRFPVIIRAFSLIGLGTAMAVSSFMLFRKNNFLPFLILVFSVIAVCVVAWIETGRFSPDAFSVASAYLLWMFVCYVIYYHSIKKPAERPTTFEYFKKLKINKMLIVVPTVLIALSGIYFGWGQSWLKENQVASSQKSGLKDLKYQLYAAKSIPAGYKLFETSLGTRENKYYSAEYRNDDYSSFLLSEYKKPARILLQPPNCAISGDKISGFEVVDGSTAANWINSSCTTVKTPSGKQVYLMSYHITGTKRYAASLIGDTLVTVSGYFFSEPELIQLFDSLEAVSISKIPIQPRILNK